ncbi:MAG TPA: sigma-70 family RNA polymerase sigma factor [Gemmataceae bacterium]|nr:sigma-70 family RNA polymerase sigma factor [Gemmataceae bacterium]
MSKKSAHTTAGRPRYLVAMVLGTALSALGAASTQAAESPETARAVQAISRYCTVCWRNARLHPDSWTDCTQEVFSRLLERIAPETWSKVLKDEGEERREFLRAIDTVKKRTQRARKPNGTPVDNVADPRDRHQRDLADERAAVREAAAQLLSPRQQRVLQMSLDGWSVHDIAAELHLPAERVSDEKYKAVRKLRERFDPTGAVERA